MEFLSRAEDVVISSRAEAHLVVARGLIDSHTLRIHRHTLSLFQWFPPWGRRSDLQHSIYLLLAFHTRTSTSTVYLG